MNSFYKLNKQLRTEHSKQGSNKETVVQSQNERAAVKSQHDIVLVP